ncbi:hypothetical protein KFE25_007619 [Diacronema lutheri]|uniref:Uncharacterized protein n=1 Tax=Diacronema lutheri TaxID=2081491 RepID=A0A8J6CFG5_DIALT|nr:hypothetical protein KFE25_007619 [Diacronema lutheri]
MPPRKATPSKPRALLGLELDHPGPAWSACGAGQRRTPTKLRGAADGADDPPSAKAKSPKRALASPAAVAKRAKSPKLFKSPGLKPSGAASLATESSFDVPPAKSPESAAKRVPKRLPDSTAQTARKQLAEPGLGEYWTAAGSRRKPLKAAATELRSASPAPARPGDAPPDRDAVSGAGEDGYDDDDEPVEFIGGGWSVNKALLACLICALASTLEQAARAGSVRARPVALFAAWGLASGAVSALWAKLLGWATLSLAVGVPRTVLTVLVDQAVMTPLMNVTFVAFVCAGTQMDAHATRETVVARVPELVIFSLAVWAAAYILNPNVPNGLLLPVCRLEQLCHAVYLAHVAEKITSAQQ